ncbi:DUF2752 domain-containing protein [Mycobacterium szulgai]|uniref:DUF2752 domain-containing protein n=1 Tax=Mycobacterium szulgai TaxID=1787 RepID=A0A1X2DNH0_MYCSZ|nr:DUF2752 domain-containing protein [Mycobacterium szulgai]MCV7074581.1 DUF2752 domain-containing protein [Mycobacterium szulgai]ORW89716.1 hypothetical protein AWC27_12575 [Mycobacterium szulgai]
MEPDQTSQASHDRKHRRRRVGLYSAAGSAALLAGTLGYIGFVDPHNTQSVYPQCPFKWLTGWNCPACGGLRMTHDLLHGDFVASINDNVFFLVGLPLLAAWVVLRRTRGQSLRSIPTAITIAVSMTAWTVLRNLPGFPLVPTVFSG